MLEQDERRFHVTFNLTLSEAKLLSDQLKTVSRRFFRYSEKPVETEDGLLIYAEPWLAYSTFFMGLCLHVRERRNEAKKRFRHTDHDTDFMRYPA